MNHWIKPFAVALLAASASAGAADIPMSESQIRSLGIETAAPVPAEGASGQAYPAEVTLPPASETVLAAPVDGLVESVHVAEGETVEQGEVIAGLRSPGLVSLQREYLQALSVERQARQAFERDRALAEDGIISERRLAETRGNYSRARADRNALEQSLELAGMSAAAVDELARSQRIDAALELVAPRSGTVMERMVAAGERVAQAAPIARISSLETLWLEVRLPVEQAAGVEPGSRVVTAGGTVDGEVILVGSRVDREDQTVMLRAEVTGEQDTLRPGQFVRVRLQYENNANLYRLPAAAVVRQGDGFFVFVSTESGFRARPVERMGESGGGVLVRGDLTPNDRVAVAGVATIKGAWQGMGGGE